MKHERASTSHSTMQTHRLAIELNSSADRSKSTPDGDEGLFFVTVEGRLAAATISPAVFDRDVPALDISGFFQPLVETRIDGRDGRIHGRLDGEEANHRHRL